MGDFGAARANLFRKPKLSHRTRRAGDTLELQIGDCGRGMGVAQGDSCVDNEIPRLLSEALSRRPLCRRPDPVSY